MVGESVVPRLLAAGRKVREMLGAPDAAPPARVSLLAPGADPHAVDAVAGSEYVDDRIRLGE